MTNSNKVVSTKTYDPKKSTNVWNFKTPSTRKTKKANQPIKKMAAYLIFLFFKFIFPCNLSSDAPTEINERHRHSAALIGTSPLHCHKKRGWETGLVFCLVLFLLPHAEGFQCFFAHQNLAGLLSLRRLQG